MQVPFSKRLSYAKMLTYYAEGLDQFPNLRMIVLSSHSAYKKFYKPARRTAISTVDPPRPRAP